MKKPTKKVAISIALALTIALILILVLTLRSCSHDHEFSSEWESDEANHWRVCSCGETADLAAHTGGTATNTQKAVCQACGREYGELAAHTHQFGEWKTKTAATCTEAEVEHRVCACTEEETRTGDAALGHNMITAYDETSHWTECDRDGCDEATDPVEHSGGTATETQKAVCEACGQPYGSVLDHEHDYVFVVVTDPTCTEAGYTAYTCSCGDSYKVDGEAALGHTAVSIRVEAKYTEQPLKGETVKAEDLAVTAACGCGVEYPVTEGIELENAILSAGNNTVTVKVAEISATVDIEAAASRVVKGSIVADTYVATDNKDKNFVEKDTMGTYSNNFKVYLRFNFSDVLNNAAYTDYKDGAKVQFSFAVAEGKVTDDTTFTLKAYNTATASFGVAFSEITFNSVKTGDHQDIHWEKGTVLVNGLPQGEVVSYADGIITITLDYSDIEQFIDPATGDALFAFATGTTKGVKIASMENDEFDYPAVEVTFSEKHTHSYTEEVAEEKYLVSANCGEQTVYYKSCACGRAGTETFEYGDVISHNYGEWETKTPATCESAEIKYRACPCGVVETREGEGALGHDKVTKYDDTHHWTECGRDDCEYKTDPVEHSGGEATEAEKAVCETCNQPYGELKDHVHAFTEEVAEEKYLVSANCGEQAVYCNSCICGEAGTETFAFGEVIQHDMATDYNETHHWEKCKREGCEYKTDPVEHSGGEATETDKAVCQTCNQPYGELKEAEKTPIAGAIVADTYVSSASGEKDNNYETKQTMNTYSNSFRVYLRFDFNAILNSEAYTDYKDSAKIQFCFAVTTPDKINEETSKFTLKAYEAATAGVDLSEITFNNVKDGATYGALNWNKGTALVAGQLQGEVVSYADGIITITLDYSDIEQYINDEGYALFAFATNTSGLKIASMENESYAAPAVYFVYE